MYKYCPIRTVEPLIANLKGKLYSSCRWLQAKHPESRVQVSGAGEVLQAHQSAWNIIRLPRDTLCRMILWFSSRISSQNHGLCCIVGYIRIVGLPQILQLSSNLAVAHLDKRQSPTLQHSSLTMGTTSRFTYYSDGGSMHNVNIYNFESVYLCSFPATGPNSNCSDMFKSTGWPHEIASQPSFARDKAWYKARTYLWALGPGFLTGNRGYDVTQAFTSRHVNSVRLGSSPNIRCFDTKNDIDRYLSTEATTYTPDFPKFISKFSAKKVVLIPGKAGEPVTLLFTRSARQ